MSTVKEAQFAPVNVNFSGAMGTAEVKAPMGVVNEPGLAYPPQPTNV